MRVEGGALQQIHSLHSSRVALNNLSWTVQKRKMKNTIKSTQSPHLVHQCGDRCRDLSEEVDSENGRETSQHPLIVLWEPDNCTCSGWIDVDYR